MKQPGIVVVSKKFDLKDGTSDSFMENCWPLFKNFTERGGILPASVSALFESGITIPFGEGRV